MGLRRVRSQKGAQEGAVILSIKEILEEVVYPESRS